MICKAYVHHSLPGRLRIKVPEKAGDSSYFRQIQISLSDLDSVDNVQVNSVTGSILLTHNNTTSSDISHFAKENHLFHLGGHDEEQVPIIDKVSQGVNRLDQQLRKTTESGVDTRALMFAAMIGMALWQIRKGQIMVPAMSLLWYAYQLLSPQKAP